MHHKEARCPTYARATQLTLLTQGLSAPPIKPSSTLLIDGEWNKINCNVSKFQVFRGKRVSHLEKLERGSYK